MTSPANQQNLAIQDKSRPPPLQNPTNVPPVMNNTNERYPQPRNFQGPGNTPPTDRMPSGQPYGPPPDHYPQNYLASVVCYYCQERGHISRWCSYRTGGQGAPRFPVPNPSSSNQAPQEPNPSRLN